MATTIKLDQKVYSKNDEIALELQAFFSKQGVFVVNWIGSPGAGKTSLLESLAPHFKGRAAVIEGDLQTDEDKCRIEKAGLPAFQINTNGACHLDARMIQQALQSFPLDGLPFLFIENVGNLVCPAGFPLGEDCKITVISVAEGDDKPAKYPVPIRVASAMVLSKIDLLPYLKCDIQRMERDAKGIHPDLAVFPLSVTQAEGIAALCTWLEEQALCANIE